MNLREEKYIRFALCREMLETADVVSAFDPQVGAPWAEAVST